MRVSRTVVVLGIASLLTDLSSEMIYPLLPAFLAVALGAGAVGVGTMEGAAETTSSLLKIVSGRLADRMRRRKPLVVGGYSISGLARPLIGFATAWPVVLVLRLIDRIGKGVRTAPRDALIADVTPDEKRGRAYGLHRSMDNAGAVLGPLVATGLLAAGFSTRQVFWSAAVPAAAVLAVLLFGVREQPVARTPRPAAQKTALSELGAPYRRLLVVVVVFTLGNSSDMFLLLRLSEAGLAPEKVAMAWAAHNLVKTLAVYLGGPLADRFDRRRILALGWLLYAASYAALGLTDAPALLVTLLIVYAVHYGAVEPTERAIVAALAPPALRGAAFGWFHGAVGLAALPASALFGILWSALGARVAFGLGAALALFATAGLLALVPSEQRA